MAKLQLNLRCELKYSRFIRLSITHVSPLTRSQVMSHVIAMCWLCRDLKNWSKSVLHSPAIRINYSKHWKETTEN